MKSKADLTLSLLLSGSLGGCAMVEGTGGDGSCESVAAAGEGEGGKGKAATCALAKRQERRKKRRNAFPAVKGSFETSKVV